MPTKIAFLKAKVQAVTSVLDQTSPAERSRRVSAHLARQFNELLEEISKEYPGEAHHLPKPIPPAGSALMRKDGVSSVSFVDLKIMAEQVLGVLSVIESDA